MACLLPSKLVRVPDTRWSFSLNPSPFDIKEHVLISVLGNSGSSYALGIEIVALTNVLFQRKIPLLLGFLLVMSHQMLGYGFLDMLIKFLVHFLHMWWPSVLVSVSFYRSVRKQLRKACEAREEDIHTNLMKKNYASVPQWWFYSILFSMIGLAIFTCEVFKEQLQLYYWGIILAVVLVFILILPNGILGATASSEIPITVFLEMIIAYLDPGKPIGNLTFKFYGFISMLAVMDFTTDFKLGHYLKIPPKSMFLAQIVGIILGSSINFGMTWCVLSSVENICKPELLPKGSPWTCPSERLAYNTAVTLSVVGPRRMLYPDGMYSGMYLFFIIGLLAPVVVWILSRAYPEKKWIRLINFPVIFARGAAMSCATAVNYWSWFLFGIALNFIVFKKHKGWWAKYNYVLSAGIQSGTAFMALLLTAALGIEGIYGINWWGLEADDHCPLAKCPTSPGIRVHGCPVVS